MINLRCNLRLFIATLRRFRAGDDTNTADNCQEESIIFANYTVVHFIRWHTYRRDILFQVTRPELQKTHTQCSIVIVTKPALIITDAYINSKKRCFVNPLPGTKPSPCSCSHKLRSVGTTIKYSHKHFISTIPTFSWTPISSCQHVQYLVKHSRPCYIRHEI